MLLGKRPRPPMKRTTSMTGMTVGQAQPLDRVLQEPTEADNINYEHHQYLMSMISPRPTTNNNPRRSSADFIETAHFLRTCGLCTRRLVSGRDIYMYKGDTAFCSLECREKQMKIDDNCKNSKNRTINQTTSSSSSSPSKTVAATT